MAPNSDYGQKIPKPSKSHYKGEHHEKEPPEYRKTRTRKSKSTYKVKPIRCLNVTQQDDCKTKNTDNTQNVEVQ